MAGRIEATAPKYGHVCTCATRSGSSSHPTSSSRPPNCAVAATRTHGTTWAAPASYSLPGCCCSGSRSAPRACASGWRPGRVRWTAAGASAVRGRELPPAQGTCPARVKPTAHHGTGKNEEQAEPRASRRRLASAELTTWKAKLEPPPEQVAKPKVTTRRTASGRAAARASATPPPRL